MPEKVDFLEKLRELKPRRVFIQVPEGLKTRVMELSREIEDAGIRAYVSVEPCYGACDIRDREAKALGCDVILHIGHSDYGVKTVLPVIYDEFRIDYDPVPLIKKNLTGLKKYRKIGLVTSVQYLSGLAKAGSFIREHGKKVLLGSPSRARHPGQILGCDYSAAKSIEKGVDCFLFMGTGRFHPLGLAMEVEKPVLFLDYESGKLEDLKQDRFSLQKLRFAQIAKAGEARRFGILVSTKPGQAHPGIAEQAKKRLEKLGRQAWILVADRHTPEKLLGLRVEALVNTACPRIREDASLFKKPIISVEDIDYLEE